VSSVECRVSSVEFEFRASEMDDAIRGKTVVLLTRWLKDTTTARARDVQFNFLLFLEGASDFANVLCLLRIVG
jgi:hypothetical protein